MEIYFEAEMNWGFNMSQTWKENLVNARLESTYILDVIVTCVIAHKGDSLTCL